MTAITYDRPENSIYLRRYGKSSQVDFSKLQGLEKTFHANDGSATVHRMYEEPDSKKDS